MRNCASVNVDNIDSFDTGDIVNVDNVDNIDSVGADGVVDIDSDLILPTQAETLTRPRALANYLKLLHT